MQSSIDENIILYDWLSFTSKDHTPQELIAALGLSHCPFAEISGMNGYKSRLYFDHIHICYDGGNDAWDMGVNVTMSGQGCRVFESMSTLKNPWIDIFQFIHSNDLSITRLDVAYDDHTGVLDIDTVSKDTEAQNFVSRFRNWSVTRSSKGTSVMIGSFKSRMLVRIYDKAAERGYDDGRHWVRVELQMRDDRAEEFSKLPLSIGEAFAGVLLNYVRFVEPDETDSNKSRWVTAAYWYDLCGDAGRISLYVAPGMEYNEEACKHYVTVQAGNAIDCCIQMFGQAEFMYMIHNRPCAQNPKYVRLIEEHKAEQFARKLRNLAAQIPGHSLFY